MDNTYRSATDLLAELQAVDESHRIEAKQATRIDRSIMETVCAFANEPSMGGGWLLLGVVRDSPDLFDNAYRVCGVHNPDQLQSDLASQCAAVLNRPLRPRVVVEQLQGQTVIVVYVAEVAPAAKPVYLRNLGLPRGAYRRVGPTDQAGSDDDLVALYAGHQQASFDSAVLDDVDWTDIDVQAIAEYRQRRHDVNPDAEELGWDDTQLLRALGCMRLNDSELKPTVAGLLLFGTTAALRRCLPMIRIDYLRVPGKQWVENPDHRFDTLEIRAPLLTAIRRATNAIRDELLQSFSLPEGALVRRDEPTLPLRVIREAVVNAVMHRSYRIHGAIQIIRYANRLEIRNPGHSIKAEDQLGEPGSETRNPHIAAVLHELNVAETKGSGIRAMRELMQQSDLLPPTFESSHSPDRFVATFLFHHFLGQDDLRWLGDLVHGTLDDEQARALVFVREVGAIDNIAYRSINRVDTLAASQHLRRLRDTGLLEMKGRGNRTYYVPTALMLDSLAAENAPATTENAPATTENAPASGKNAPAEIQLRRLLASMPTGLRDKLPTSGSRRLHDAALRELIQELCGWQPLTARELTALLQRRNAKYLVRKTLSPMLAAGLLAYTIPQMENHPEQRYTLTAAQTDDE